VNDVNLSMAEYQWIRDQAYRALGVPHVEIDICYLVDEVQKGVTNSMDPGMLPRAIGPQARQAIEAGRALQEGA
jgi:hypothetical protein